MQPHRLLSHTAENTTISGKHLPKLLPLFLPAYQKTTESLRTVKCLKSKDSVEPAVSSTSTRIVVYEAVSRERLKVQVTLR